MQTLVARDLDAVRRNFIRQAFLDIVKDHKLSDAQAKSLLDDALTKQFEYVETEILPENDKTCLKCGKAMAHDHGFSLCNKCKSERYMKPCIECPRLVGRNASRCFECNKKYMAELRRAKRNG